MTLDTVQDYVDEARVLLQDLVAPYRYSDASIVSELNIGMLETRKMRPDLFLAYNRTTYPTFSTTDMTMAVPFEPMYRPAMVYYIVGKCILRDEEDADETRAGKFLAKHGRQLLTVEG